MVCPGLTWGFWAAVSGTVPHMCPISATNPCACCLLNDTCMAVAFGVNDTIYSLQAFDCRQIILNGF
jgi:hypothetical protein